MEKLAIALINHKGGVGKTTLAYVLSQIALSQGLAVSTVDLDPQRNLSDTLCLVKKAAANQDKSEIFNNLNVTTSLTDKGDLIIIDCPPALNASTREAMSFADITLVPVIPDLFSLVNLELVYKFGEECEKNREQLALVKVGFDKRAITEIVASNINTRQYAVAGAVPINRLIPYNVLHGRLWQHGLSAPVKEPFYKLYKHVTNVYSRMLKGEIDDVWK